LTYFIANIIYPVNDRKPVDKFSEILRLNVRTYIFLGLWYILYLTLNTQRPAVVWQNKTKRRIEEGNTRDLKKDSRMYLLKLFENIPFQTLMSEKLLINITGRITHHIHASEKSWGQEYLKI